MRWRTLSGKPQGSPTRPGLQLRLGAGGVAAEEGGDFVAIATDGHGTPAAAARTGIVVEEEATGRIRTAADGSAWTFDEEFGGGAGNRGEEPFQATFACHKVKGPGTFAGDELVVTFGDTKDFIDGLDPGTGERFLVHKGSENGTERFAKAKNTQEYSVDGMGFGGKKRAQASSAILGDQTGVYEEGDKFTPREIAGGGRGVGEVERKTASHEARSRGGAARGHNQ